MAFPIMEPKKLFVAAVRIDTVTFILILLMNALVLVANTIPSDWLNVVPAVVFKLSDPLISTESNISKLTNNPTPI